jgi:hypothetical protein
MPKHGLLEYSFDGEMELKCQICQLDTNARNQVIIESGKNQIHLTEFCITLGSKGYFQILKRNSGFDGHSAHLWGQR